MIAKSDLVILVVSSSLLGVSIYRWDQNTRHVNTSTVLANTQVVTSVPNPQPVAPSETLTVPTYSIETSSNSTVATTNPVPTYATNTTIVQSTTTAAEVVTEPLPAVVNEPPAIRYLGYTVRSGDSLSEIAERYNTTVVALRDINGIEGSTIFIGQEILYPSSN